MRCAQHIGVGGVGFFNGHFVVKAAGNHEFGHFLTAAQLIDKVAIQPRFVNFQLGIGQQTIAVETLDIVAFVSAAVAPDVYAIFFHRCNQHGAGHRAAQRGGVKVGQTASSIVESTALNRGDTFCDQLFTAVDQTSAFCTVLFGATRDCIVIFFVRLAQVCSIGIRNCAFFAHPQQCGAGIQTTRESDTNTLTNREMLKNRRHKIKPC